MERLDRSDADPVVSPPQVEAREARWRPIAGIAAVFLVFVLVGSWPWISMVWTTLMEGSGPGELFASTERGNGSFRIRLDCHRERNGGFLPGAYYIFLAGPGESEEWTEFMRLRHDDQTPPLPDQIRFVSRDVGYAFMTWKYGVTTDGGATWTVWDASSDSQLGSSVNYGFIEDVEILPDGTGSMRLNNLAQQRGAPATLVTSDFGKHWSH